MEQFLAMGGYADYVWPAYGISLLVLASAVVWTLTAERRVMRRLAQLEGSRA